MHSWKTKIRSSKQRYLGTWNRLFFFSFNLICNLETTTSMCNNKSLIIFLLFSAIFVVYWMVPLVFLFPFSFSKFLSFSLELHFYIFFSISVYFYPISVKIYVQNHFPPLDECSCLYNTSKLLLFQYVISLKMFLYCSCLWHLDNCFTCKFVSTQVV